MKSAKQMAQSPFFLNASSADWLIIEDSHYRTRRNGPIFLGIIFVIIRTENEDYIYLFIYLFHVCFDSDTFDSFTYELNQPRAVKYRSRHVDEFADVQLWGRCGESETEDGWREGLASDFLRILTIHPSIQTAAAHRDQVGTTGGEGGGSSHAHTVPDYCLEDKKK